MMQHIGVKGMMRCAVLALAFAMTARSATLSTPTVELKADAGNLMLWNRVMPREWASADLALTLFEGKSKRQLAGETTVTELPNGIRVSVISHSWRYTVDFTRRGEVIHGQAQFANLSKQELWIEPGLKATLGGKRKPMAFWDGFGKVREIQEQTVSRKGIKGLALEHVGSKELPFPATAVLFSESSLHFGHLIFDPVSYSAVFYDPKAREFRFVQRFALQAEETVAFNWVIGCASTSYGGPEAAVQQHYDAFPERWAVSMGQENPYVWGNAAHYHYWKNKPDLELGRRLGETLDWAYTPYKRAGDIACRQEFWDYRPDNPWDKQYMRLGGMRFHFESQDREEFLKLRHEAYRKWGRKLGWMFYANCAGTWCERQLATQHYPDSINNTDKNSSHFLKKWSTHQDSEFRVFPMGTSFARAFEEDMRNLTEELDIPGFALDCGSGGVSFRGKAVQQRLPGRAWDDDGVFIDQSVAVNHVVDFIHSLRPDMTVFLNGPLKGDLIMFERSFADSNAMTVMMPLYQWYIGPRPAAIWSGYHFMDMVASWRSLSPEEFRHTMFKLGVFHMFQIFRLGMTAYYDFQYGVPDLQYIQPELHELIRAGWRALVPVRLAGGLYAPYQAAYGGGASTFLFFGNSKGDDCRGTVMVENGLLTGHSGEALVFVRKMRGNATLTNRVDGGFTCFDTVFPARAPALFETVCAISGAPAKLVVEATSTKSLEIETYTATLQETPAFTGSIAIRDIRGFEAELQVNGRKAVAGKPLPLKAGDVIKVIYHSRLFQLPQESLDGFPFTDAKGKVICTVWADAGDQPALESAAAFDRFFAFLQKNGVLPRGASLKISSEPALRGSAGVITLDSRARKKAIRLAATGGLLVEGDGGSELERSVNELLKCLDRRYPYVFPFRATGGGLPKDVLNYFGMTGKSLSERRFFE